MLNFHYNIPTEIFFGKDEIKVLGKQILKYGKKVLLVYGGGSIKRNGIYDEIMEIFKKNEILHYELPNVKPNPRIESVREGIKICKEKNIDIILAVGGGSTIDCSKVIAAGYYYEGDPWEIVLDPSKIKKALPLATVLTLSATGSEMDSAAVISNMETNEKYGTGHPSMFPKFSILDPQYTFSVSKKQTSAGIADILCHVFEVYFSVTDGAYIQNRLAESVMKTLIHYSEDVMKDPSDYEARANIMWASSLAINGLLSYGKITEWTMHKMEHELSAFYDITHGTGLAIIMPRWMKYSLNDKTIDKYAEYAVNVWDLDPSMDKRSLAEKGIEKTEKFLYDTLSIPSSLSALGIGSENFRKMSEKSVARTKDGSMGNFLKLYPEDVLKIYEACL